MIVEIEEESRDFTTIYKKNYSRRKVEKTTECRPVPKYPPPLNILNGPYQQQLRTRRENQLLPENERCEDPMGYLNRIRDKYPHLKNTLPHVMPDESVIKRENEKPWKTIHQSDYTKECDFQLHRLRKIVTLPEKWVIPETAQKYTYRNPWVIAARDLLKPPKMVKPCNNLDPNIEERKILHITTGNSEYIGTIGATGDKILLLRSPPDVERRIRSRELSSPEISESECSLILKQSLVLPSRVF